MQSIKRCFRGSFDAVRWLLKCSILLKYSCPNFRDTGVLYQWVYCPASTHILHEFFSVFNWYITSLTTFFCPASVKLTNPSSGRIFAFGLWLFVTLFRASVKLKRSSLKPVFINKNNIRFLAYVKTKEASFKMNFKQAPTAREIHKISCTSSLYHQWMLTERTHHNLH